MAAPAGPVVLDFPYLLDSPGLYRFELRMTNASGSSLMASSPIVEAEFSIVAPPGDLNAAWLDEDARLLRLGWFHPDPAGVDWYEVEESAPGSTEPSVQMAAPGSVREITFDYAQGPWGSYGYRVRACVQEIYGAECSAWAGPIHWWRKSTWACRSRTGATAWRRWAYPTTRSRN